jgi:hypothetical protein
VSVQCSSIRNRYQPISDMFGIKASESHSKGTIGELIQNPSPE